MVRSSYKTWTREERERLFSLAQHYKKDFERLWPHFPGREMREIKCCYYNQLYRTQGRYKPKPSAPPAPVVQPVPRHDTQELVRQLLAIIERMQ